MPDKCIRWVLQIGLLLYGFFLMSCGQQQSSAPGIEGATVLPDGVSHVDLSTFPAENPTIVTTTIPIESTSTPPVVASTSPSTARVEGKSGDIIAFVSDRRERNNLDIWIIDVETRQVEALTSTPPQEWYPLWSPDGQKLAYLSAESQEDLYVVIIELETRTVLNRLYKPDIWSISWSADSNSLWLETYSGVWQYNILDGTSIKRFDNARPVVEAWNGNFLAIGVESGEETHTSELLIQNAEGTILPVQFSDKKLDTVLPNYFAWAHTSANLAVTFQPIRSSFTGQISIFSLSEGVFEEVATRLGEDASLDFCRPAWSPATDSYLSYAIAWSYAEVPCLGDVYVAQDDLSQTIHISNNATITQQPWSPTGNQLVFSQDAKSPWWAPSRSFGFPGEGSIWISNYDGSGKRLLTDGNWYDGEAVWQPK